MNHYFLGKFHLDNGAYEQANAHFTIGFANGDLYCTYGLLAIAFLTGTDCTEPIARLKSVFPELEKLAGQHDREACFILGRCYETGSAVTQDIPSAMKYYTQAAVQNHLDAMFNLGCIYMSFGTGGERIAVDYFEQAAQIGHRRSQLALNHYLQTHT